MADEQQIADGAIDPNVTIPKHVRDATAASEAAFNAVYQTETPPVETPAEAIQPNPEPAPQPPVVADAPPIQPEPPREPAGDDESWRHKFLSMQGRWQASQRQIGQLQQLNTDLGTELGRTQELLTRSGTLPAPRSGKADTPHEKLITDQDVDTYGHDLIDVARRAGLEAVKPQLDALSAENATLKKTVTVNAQRELKSELLRAVPNWVQVQQSQEFQQWLHLPNIYTNQVRGRMLNAAYEAADAPKVIALFKDFLREVDATGGTPPAPRSQQAAAASAPTPPRQAVVGLETLAAPGKARPASGDTVHQSADKPTYTRAQIQNFYRDVRRGAYSGRDAVKNATEADIIAAQGQGRVRG